MYDYLHDENLFEMNMALRCEVKNLKRIVEEYQSGKRYLKIQEDHNRVTNGYIREIKRLRKEIEEAHALIKTYIETCRRNNINEIIALQRLCDGKPYTVQEILSQASK